MAYSHDPVQSPLTPPQESPGSGARHLSRMPASASISLIPPPRTYAVLPDRRVLRDTAATRVNGTSSQSHTMPASPTGTLSRPGFAAGVGVGAGPLKRDTSAFEPPRKFSRTKPSTTTATPSALPQPLSRSLPLPGSPPRRSSPLRQDETSRRTSDGGSLSSEMSLDPQDQGRSPPAARRATHASAQSPLHGQSQPRGMPRYHGLEGPATTMATTALPHPFSGQHDSRRSTPPGSPTTMHVLKSDFNDLRKCFAELSVTVARQHERIRFLESLLADVLTKAATEVQQQQKQ